MEYLAVETISEIKNLVKILNDKKNLPLENRPKTYEDEIKFLNKSIVISEYKIFCQKMREANLSKDDYKARLEFAESELSKAYEEKQKLDDLYYDKAFYHDLTSKQLKIDKVELEARIDAIDYVRIDYYSRVKNINLMWLL